LLVNLEEWKYNDDINLCFHLEEVYWFWKDFFEEDEEKRKRSEQGHFRMIVANVFEVK